MNRLTKKTQFVRNLITGKEIKYISNESDQMCVDKLGALEDIEEGLGMDLITLFKALKKGVYVKLDSDFGNIGELDIKIVKKKASKCVLIS